MGQQFLWGEKVPMPDYYPDVVDREKLEKLYLEIMTALHKWRCQYIPNQERFALEDAYTALKVELDNPNLKHEEAMKLAFEILSDPDKVCNPEVLAREFQAIFAENGILIPLDLIPKAAQAWSEMRAKEKQGQSIYANVKTPFVLVFGQVNQILANSLSNEEGND